MKNQKGSTTIILTVIFILVCILVFLFWINSERNTQQITSTPIQTPNNEVGSSSPKSSPDNNSQFLKEYSSTNLKATINLSDNTQIEDKPGRLTLSKNGNDIYIERNGTNFNDLDEYITDLDSKNKKNVIEEKLLSISNYQTNMRIIKFGSGEIQKVFYIFSDNWVYTVFTNSVDLYDELDQIAQSFRYTP